MAMFDADYDIVANSKSNKYTLPVLENYLNKLSLQYNTPYEPELIFDKIHKRKFRFDYCFTDLKLAIEIEGGIWRKEPTGHAGGKGITKDIEKYNLAALNGYTVIRFTYQQKFEYVEQVIKDMIILKLNG
jgi:hypothetical protein